MIIYLTTNNINRKIYVGKYCGTYKNYLGSGIYIKRAIKKYGKENFVRETLEDNIDDHDYLCEREIYWIKFYDATNPEIGYNLCKGGGGLLGFKHLEKTKEKMSESAMGHIVSKETKEKIVKNHVGMTGKSHSEETKEKLRIMVSRENNPMWGKHHSIETRKKIGLAVNGRNNPMFGKHHSKETVEKIKKINYISKEKVLKIIEMLNDKCLRKDISKKLSVCKTTIRKVKNGYYDDIYNLKD